MKATNTVYVTIRLDLLQRVFIKDEVEELISEMGYDVNHSNIKSTEITDFEIKWRGTNESTSV